jgi:hypothetical protein
MLRKRSFQVISLLAVMLAITVLAGSSFWMNRISAEEHSSAGLSHLAIAPGSSAGDASARDLAPRSADDDSTSLLPTTGVSPLDAYYGQRAQELMEKQRAIAASLADRRLSGSERYYMQRTLRYIRLAQGQSVDDLPR